MLPIRLAAPEAKSAPFLSGESEEPTQDSSIRAALRGQEFFQQLVLVEHFVAYGGIEPDDRPLAMAKIKDGCRGAGDFARWGELIDAMKLAPFNIEVAVALSVDVPSKRSVRSRRNDRSIIGEFE